MKLLTGEDMIDYPSCPICGTLMEPPVLEFSSLDVINYCVCSKCGHVHYYEDET